jgi:hypothetical protein
MMDVDLNPMSHFKVALSALATICPFLKLKNVYFFFSAGRVGGAVGLPKTRGA